MLSSNDTFFTSIFPNIEPTGKYSVVISPVIFGAPTCLLLKKLTLFVRQITRRLAGKIGPNFHKGRCPSFFHLKKNLSLTLQPVKKRSLYFF